MTSTAEASVDEAITSRRSVRAFRPDPVPRETVAQIVEVAARAPSGTNTQPWQVHVFTGDAKERLSEVVLKEFWDENASHSNDREHYMGKNWRDPYLARRRKVGWDLYGLLNIGKGDFEKTRLQHAENFRFFGAPVGMIFTIDKDMGWMSWLDYGMFLQNICVAARGRGLHTCPQAAWGQYHDVLGPHLGLNGENMAHCGLSLGYEDEGAVINQLRTEREPVEGFVSFHED